MSSLVTVETRKVYRAEGRTFLRPSAAYYAIAKRMVLERHQDTERFDRLFYSDCGDGYNEPRHREFDVAKRQRLVRRLARFLRYVDSRREGTP